jgi:hypothetical protein
MRLGAVVRILRQGKRGLDPKTATALIADYENHSRRLLASGELGEAHRMVRRITALEALLRHGPHPGKMVAETELPEGYRGKILLVVLNGGGFEGLVCLRSGDEWHREILRNTQAEIADLGFLRTRVYPLGGACACFEPDGNISIWGTSDEFGCCDKEVAAKMISRAHPGWKVIIEQ